MKQRMRQEDCCNRLFCFTDIQRVACDVDVTKAMCGVWAWGACKNNDRSLRGEWGHCFSVSQQSSTWQQLSICRASSSSRTDRNISRMLNMTFFAKNILSDKYMYTYCFGDVGRRREKSVCVRYRHDVNIKGGESHLQTKLASVSFRWHIVLL